MKMPNDVRKALDDQGMCVLHSCRLEDAETIASGLGEIVSKTDVIIRHQDRDGPLVTSDRAMDIHTDHPDVKYVFLHCLQNSSEGGFSLLSDFNKFSHRLTQEDKEVLKNVFLFEHDVFGTGNSTSPLLRIDEMGRIKIYFSFWHVDSDDRNKESVKEFYRLAKKHIYSFRLSKGDVLIIDNQRVMHGRTAIGGDKRRHIKRFWIAAHALSTNP